MSYNMFRKNLGCAILPLFWTYSTLNGILISL